MVCPWLARESDANITTPSQLLPRLWPPSQVAADCLTGNGRMPSEGEALVTWMVENQAEWRTPSVKDVTPVEERRDGS